MWWCRLAWGLHEGANGSASLAQHLVCLERIHDAVVAVGKPPPDLSGPEALNELRVKPGYAGEPANLAPFQADLVSLEGEARNVVEVVCDAVLPESEARARREISDLKSPYMDPLLRSNKHAYSGCVLRLHDAGLVEFRRSCRERVGAFTV